MTTPSPQALLKGLQLFQGAQALHAARKPEQAAAAYLQALALLPNHPQILIAAGTLAEETGDWKTAEKNWRHLRSVANINNLDGKLGSVLFQQEKYEEAIPLLDAYATRNPADAAALRMLATGCFRTMQFDDTVRHARRAWALEPHPDAICLLLATFLELGDGDALGPLVAEALTRFPEHWQVRKMAAEHLLKSGDYARGFRFFTEMRIPVDGAPHYVEGLAMPWWDGQRFDGTLLVGGEQGIGDEILVSGFYRDLVDMGQRAIIEADPRLLTLLRRSFPTLEFVARRERGLLRDPDDTGVYRKTISGNLGQFFRATPGWQQPPQGWLLADPERVASFVTRYAASWPGRRRVGISWKSQRELKSGARKDVSPENVAALLAHDDAVFFNLQYGDITADRNRLPDPARLVIDATVDTYNDMDALFAQIAALDLVITTSNVTAHIAGAVGTPCWVILPKQRPVIWYWGYRGETTPWYPRARLFRNDAEDDWRELFYRVAGTFSVWITERLGMQEARP